MQCDINIKQKGLCYQPFTPDTYQLVWYDLNFFLQCPWEGLTRGVRWVTATAKFAFGCSLIPTMLDQPFSFMDLVGKEHIPASLIWIHAIIIW